MTFGKRASQYLEFQQVSLGLLAVVGLTRLGLSLAGLPLSTVINKKVVRRPAVA